MGLAPVAPVAPPALLNPPRLSKLAMPASPAPMAGPEPTGPGQVRAICPNRPHV